MASEGDAANTAPAQRPKLNLKPRDPARAAQLEQERQHSIKKNPFGDAKPREAIIASRVGKTEEEILKEEVKKEKLHLRLNPQQLDEKRGHEAAVKEVEDEISLEDDPSKREVLQAELVARQQKLEALMERFEKMALETALSGEAPRVSQVRRQLSGQPDALGGPVPGMSAPSGRYNPTQQYGGQYGGGRGGRGGYDYGGAPRSGYQPTRSYAGGHQGGGGFEQGGYEGGHRQGGGGGGFRQGGGRGYQPAGGPRDDSFGEGFDRPSGGGRSYNQSGGYGDSDQGFFDAPSLSASGGGGYGGGYGGGRGRGRGRGRDNYGGGRDNYGGGSYGGGPYGGGKDYGEPGYGNGFGSQGIGGEIHIETQDRF